MGFEIFRCPLHVREQRVHESVLKSCGVPSTAVNIRVHRIRTVYCPEIIRTRFKFRLECLCIPCFLFLSHVFLPLMTQRLIPPLVHQYYCGIDQLSIWFRLYPRNSTSTKCFLVHHAQLLPIRRCTVTGVVLIDYIGTWIWKLGQLSHTHQWAMRLSLKTHISPSVKFWLMICKPPDCPICIRFVSELPLITARKSNPNCWTKVYVVNCSMA